MMQEIPIDDEIESFRIHLENNCRVVLTGQFGDGKTYFLKEMQKALADKYYFVTLYPVNYSVARNEDIFEYIKRDILLRLAKEGILNNIDFEAVADSCFNWENLRAVISFLLTFVPRGTFYDKLLSKAEEFKKSYDEKKKTWDKFESTFVAQRGGLYEHDAYTKLIENAIDYIQHQVKDNDKRKAVLIIEDLDRIDPAHLFRILNVLGAHIDEDKNTNKFGFSNIVVVLDYDKTEHLFHHFYGGKANYSGYMCKFMSHYPFRYSLKRVADDFLYDYINKECGLHRDITASLQLSYEADSSFANALEGKSVRDIAQILDGIDEQITDEIIEFEGNYMIRTSTSIVKFLAVLKRMNVRFNLSELLRSLKRLEGVEALNLLGDFMMVELALRNGACFHYKRELVGVNQSSNGEINTCLFIKGGGGYNVDIDIPKVMTKAFSIACEYVKDMKR